MNSKLEQVVGTLQQDLGRLQAEDLGISEYNQNVLRSKLDSLSTCLARDAYIVDTVLSKANGNLGKFCFVEYGGGTGFLSLLAKRLGVGTVVYNDIYGVSCNDAVKIARAVDAEADHYVEGDINALVEFCSRHKITADAVASHDVLEHVYDVNDFFEKLCLISRKGTVMMHSSGANMFFPPHVNTITKKHIEVETQDREDTQGHKQIDCLSSYYKERVKIIKRRDPSLQDDEVEELAYRTRGLAKTAIETIVWLYGAQGKWYPEPIKHPTNTCDPHTGNWAERLMNPYYLQGAMAYGGFDVKVLPGPWVSSNRIMSKIKTMVLNMLAGLPRSVGLHFASYYSIYAEYQGGINPIKHKQRMYPKHKELVWYLAVPFWKVAGRFV